MKVKPSVLSAERLPRKTQGPGTRLPLLEQLSRNNRPLGSTEQKEGDSVRILAIYYCRNDAQLLWL